MAESLLPYHEMVERAMRGVVRDALTEVAENGLPGEHHFYITFRTGADGVDIPAALTAQYPDEMTIVLQHRFWGLDVTDEWFEVTLSFGGVSSLLHIPFSAVIGFVDPSVNFGLQFGAFQAAAAAASDETAAAPAESGNDGDESAGGDGDVITLDSFRKK